MKNTMKFFFWLVVLVGMGWFADAQQIDAPQPIASAATNESATVDKPAQTFVFTGAWFQSAAAGQQAPKKTKTQSGPPKPMNPPEIDPSMVGYIDDASIGNQVRVRFDAGFDTPRPDRAEYFYQGSPAPNPPTSATQRTLNFQELYLSGEYAPFKRLSAFAMLPFRWIQPIFIVAPGTTPGLSDEGGISDLQAGLKFAVLSTERSLVTLQLRSYFPTGDGPHGLGTGHYSIEPLVLFYQKLNDRTALEGEAGDTHPIGGTMYMNPPSPPRQWSADVAMYGLGASYRLIQRDSYSFAPVLELVAWHVYGGLQTGSNNQAQSAAGINVFNAKLGGRISFTNGSSIYAGYGRGITSDIWYRNLFRIEYRKSF